MSHTARTVPWTPQPSEPWSEETCMPLTGTATHTDAIENLVSKTCLSMHGCWQFSGSICTALTETAITHTQTIHNFVTTCLSAWVLTDLWKPSSQSLKDLWLLSGSSGNCQLSESSLAALWKLSGNSLDTFWKLSGNWQLSESESCLAPFWKLSDSSLKALWWL